MLHNDWPDVSHVAKANLAALDDFACRAHGLILVHLTYIGALASAIIAELCSVVADDEMEKANIRKCNGKCI